MEKVLMKGNEALGEAAIRSGCRHFFGYPITPQTELSAYLAKKMPKIGGTFLQAESEMFGRLLESFCIDAYSVAFNVDKYRYEWHFNFIKEMFGRLLFQFLFKYVLQL